MKKGLLLILALTLLVGVIFADTMAVGPQKTGLTIPKEISRVITPSREEATYTFSVAPNALLTSYYDYMIGSYNDIPLNVNPNTYGGYFLTFHGQRTATGTRRVFYGYIDNSGVVQNLNEVTSVQNREGYPSVAVDPISGKPLYAWHANADGTTDTQLEVQAAWDAFLDGAAGLMSDPFTVVNNPTAIPTPATTDNEFIWPTVQIGPSPTAGMRRAYILCRNSISHVSNTNPSENVYIAYADFNADMIETGQAMTWSYTHIPAMDTWNSASEFFHRPNHAFAVGNDGRIYYAGYKISSVIADDGDLVEPDISVFICSNYGAGTWAEYTFDGSLPSYNPVTIAPDTGLGFFEDNATNPIASDSLFWGAINSSHINTIVDNEGKVHFAALWAQQFRENTPPLSTYYHSAFQTVKELSFDPDTEEFHVNEIYPIAGSATDDIYWKAWDQDGDGTVDEYDTASGTPLMATTWPFPYWDDTVHDAAMMFHYNSIKLSTPNAQGMMVALWEDCLRARDYNLYPDSYPEFAAYATAPEIYIACSPDQGGTWSDPIVLNKVDTPELANMKPMWSYPADQVKYVNTVDGHKVGKLGIMFYDDNTWGAYAITPPVGQNDGGTVRFMELEITFPLSQGEEDNNVTPVTTMLQQNYPNPFNPNTTISFNVPKSGTATLNVYNTKGQLVKTLINGNVAAGSNSLTWDSKDNNGNVVSSGLYFYKLTSNGKVETRKMMLMK